VTAVTDSDGGYGGARISQGSWRVLVQPPSPRPPLRTGPFDTTAPVLDFVLPRMSALQRLDGVLIGADGGLAGASVTAVDALGTAISASSVSQADGGYNPLPAVLAGNAFGPESAAGRRRRNGCSGPWIRFDVSPVLYQPASRSTCPRRPRSTARCSTPRARPCPRPRVRAQREQALDAGALSDHERRGRVCDDAPGRRLCRAGSPVDGRKFSRSLRRAVGHASRRWARESHLPAQGRSTGSGADRGWAVRRREFPDPGHAGPRRPGDDPCCAPDCDGLQRDLPLVGDPGRWRITVVPRPRQSARNIVQVDLVATDPGPSALPAIRISPPLEVVAR